MTEKFDRSTGIGSSEIAAALGLSRWKTPFALYAEKRGLVPPQEENDAMAVGKAMQRPVAELYAKRKGVKITWLDEPIRSSADPWMFASPDFQVLEREGGEVKTTASQHGWGKEGTDEIPEEFVLQTQWQMAVAGYLHVLVPVLFTVRKKLAVYVVERDDEMIEGMKIGAKELWDRIVSGNAPPLDHSPEASEYLRSRFPAFSGERELREATEDEAELVLELYRRRQELKSLEMLTKGLENCLKEQIGDYAGICGDDFKALWTDYKGSTYTVTKKPGRMLKLSGPMFKQKREEVEV